MLRKPQVLKEEQKTFNIPPAPNQKTREDTTRVVVKYDVGFGNSLFIRGKGANLSWDKGIPMQNTQNDEWVWETEAPFLTGEFKVLINDAQYEIGENHILKRGSQVQYSPNF